MSDEQDNWTERQMQFLKYAIAKAEKNGWENVEGYRPINVMGYIFLIKRDVPPNFMFSTRELLFDHDFAKALWGTEEVDNHGVNLKAIRLWADQIAVKHAGKLHAVEPDRPVVSIYDTPDLDFSKPPEELVEGTITQYKLEKLAASLSFETHRLRPVEIDAVTQPAYFYHMQQMATFENAEDYLSPLSLPSEHDASKLASTNDPSKPKSGK